MKIKFLLGQREIPEEVRIYAKRKAEKTRRFLKEYNDQELFYEIEIGSDKKGFWRVEVMIKTPHHLFRAEMADGNILRAIDEVEEALKRQIKKEKERLIDLQKRGGRSIKKKYALDKNSRF